MLITFKLQVSMYYQELMLSWTGAEAGIFERGGDQRINTTASSWGGLHRHPF
jgi:hypothetical protein